MWKFFYSKWFQFRYANSIVIRIQPNWNNFFNLLDYMFVIVFCFVLTFMLFFHISNKIWNKKNPNKLVIYSLSTDDGQLKPTAHRNVVNDIVFRLSHHLLWNSLFEANMTVPQGNKKRFARCNRCHHGWVFCNLWMLFSNQIGLKHLQFEKVLQRHFTIHFWRISSIFSPALQLMILINAQSTMWQESLSNTLPTQIRTYNETEHIKNWRRNLEKKILQRKKLQQNVCVDLVFELRELLVCQFECYQIVVVLVYHPVRICMLSLKLCFCSTSNQYWTFWLFKTTEKLFRFRRQFHFIRL